MKTSIKRILAALLSIIMLCICGNTVLAMSINALESTDRRSSSNASETIIPPVRVPYGHGDTLKNSGSQDAVTDPLPSENDTYSPTIEPIKSKQVNLEVPSDTSVEVFNAAGSLIMPDSEFENPNGSHTLTYSLVPREQYTYITTSADYYHALAQFMPEEGTIHTAKPDTQPKLIDFGAYSGRNINTAVAYAISPEFAINTHEYIIELSDRNTNMYVLAETSDTEYEVHAIYSAQTSNPSTNGNPMDKLISGTTPIACGQFLSNGGFSNQLTMRLSKQTGSVTYYQDYVMKAVRRLSLNSLEVRQGENSISLMDSTGNIVSYDRDRTEYYLDLSSGIDELTLISAFNSTDSGAPNQGGYYALINGIRFDDISIVNLPLNTELTNETIAIEIHHSDPASISSTYTLHIKKHLPTRVIFNTDPLDAIIFMLESSTGRIVEANADGSFSLMPGLRYSYNVTANGYIGLNCAEYIPVESETAVTINVSLRPSTAQQPNDLPAQWPSFRADNNNNGVVDYRMPISSDESVLYWAEQFGEGYSGNACSCPIIVDDDLFLYAGTRIYRVDKHTGETICEGSMAGSSSFAINPPTYADGMIFVGLSNGRVQAFDAETLQSLWIYTDPLGGQPNCPITYHDGYIYTGFWKSETSDASFVCISVTDENGRLGNEAKLASWRYISKGGFYWTGAYICDDFVMITTDDGESGYTTGYASILMLDTRTGRLLDKLILPHAGDARSSITYDIETNAYYFTTKGGYFYGVRIQGNRFARGSLRFIKLRSYSNDSNNPAMSTCTPTIYNGRAYIGVSGTSQFGQYSGHNITVLDLHSMSIAYSVRTQGYPQTSGILTTAYETEDGYVYVYFLDNFTPGKLRIIKDKANQTRPIELTSETYQGVSYDVAPALFTPDGAQAQYAICSPIVDSDGTIYFKNDSAYLMALGSTITEIEIASPPSKTIYSIGSAFEPDGMTVIAHFANGLSRDVTEYVAYSAAPLTINDTEFQVSYPITMYHDENGTAGIEYHAPIGIVQLQIGYTATFTINGEIYAVITCEPGASIPAPEYEVPDGCIFSGWNIPAVMPAENIVLNATLDFNNSCIVTFIDGLTGSTIATQEVLYGSAANAPAAPAHDGYVFIGWDSEFTAVTADMTVTAEYRMLGDADSDGKLTMVDVILVMRYVLSLQPDINPIVIDIDGDGSHNMNDAIILFRIVLNVRALSQSNIKK